MLIERPRVKGSPIMRIRLAAMIAAAIVLLPVTTASASTGPSQPDKKCPESMSFILDHCD